MLKERIIKGLFSGAFGQGVTIFVQLVSIPLFLNYWGVDLYGEWLIISAIPTFLVLSNIGLPKTAGNSIAMLPQIDNSKKLEIYQSTWVMVTVLSVIFICIFFLVVYLVDIYSLANIKIISRSTFNLTLFLLLLHVALTFQSGILVIAYRAIKKNPLGEFLNHMIRLIEWIALSIIVFLGMDMISVAISLVCVRIILNIVYLYRLRNNNNPLYLGISYFRFREIKRLLKPSIATMAFPLGLALMLQGILLLVAHFLNPASVVIFNIYRTLTRIVVQSAAVINHSIWPEISYAYAEKNIALIKNLTKRSLLFNLIIGATLIIFLYFFNQTIINIWTNKTIQHNSVLFNLLLVVTSFHIIWQSSWITQMALNKHVNFSYLFLLTSFITIFNAYFLIPEYNIEGAAIAMIIGELCLMFFSLITLKRTFKNL